MERGLLPGGCQDHIDRSPGGELRSHTRSWWEGNSFHKDLPWREVATGYPGPRERDTCLRLCCSRKWKE